MTADPLFDVEGRVVVVTGGEGQLGSELVDAFAARGARVAVFDTTVDPAPEQAGEVRSYVVDVTHRDQLEAATMAVVAEWGVPHVLVCAAALDSPPDAPPEEVGPVEDVPVEAFDRVMDVNVKGVLLTCQVVGGLMAEESRGSIIVVSSVYGMVSPDQRVYEFRREQGIAYAKPVAYSASKAALLNLARYLATYWAERDVRVNTVSFAGVWNEQPPPFLEAYLPRVPLGRMARVEEVVGPVLFLASDASSYVTGANLVADGGYTAW